MGNSELKSKTVKSLFWSFLDKFGQQIIYLISSVVLMNIVDPSEYGLIGALTVFIVFSSLLVDSGFGRALLNRKVIEPIEYSSVFYFNIFLGVFLYVILFFSAPYLADIFHDARIEPVSRVLFISLILNALGVVQQIKLTKVADFRGLTKLNLTALLISASIAIFMAIKGYGVWALVAQTIGYAFFRVIFLWIYSNWRPVLRFSFSTLKNSMGLSNKLLLAGLINAVFNNIYPAIIAFFYPNSMRQVGYFTQASKYQDIPFGMLSNTFRSVSMLILPLINSDTERLNRVVSKIMKSLAFLSFPIGFYMILAAEPAFHLLFGDKWNEAIPYFKVLAIAGMFSPFTFILNELYIARERADFFLGLEVVKRVFLVLFIFLLFRFGIMGLALSWVAYMIFTVITSLLLSKKLINYSLIDFMKDSLPYLLISFASTALAYLTTSYIYNNLAFLIVSVLITGASYWYICKLLRLEMSKEVSNFFSSKKPVMNDVNNSEL